MGRQPAPTGRDRGGARIQASRRTGTVLAAASIAAAGAGGFAAACVATSAAGRTWVAAVAGAGVVLVLAGVTVTPRLVRPALLLLGAAYTIALASRGGGVHASGAFYAAGLVVVAETAFACWHPVDARWWRELVAVAGAVLLLAALILAVASLPLTGGLVVDGLGAAATIAALSLIAFFARRAGRSSR